MNEGEQDQLFALAKFQEKRARTIMTTAGKLVGDEALPLEVRQAASKANVGAFGAWLLYRMNRPALAGAYLAMAEQHFAMLYAKATEPDTETGRVFNEARSLPRRDDLAKLIDDSLAVLPPKATATQVLNMCEAIGKDRGVIQEIDEDEPDGPVIYWRGRGGREHSSSFKAFQNRLTAHRKKKRKSEIPGFD